jgi:hypothetical protein
VLQIVDDRVVVEERLVDVEEKYNIIHRVIGSSGDGRG